MPSVYNELCLACSGSAVSGSQRQHASANDKHRNRSSIGGSSRRSLLSCASPELEDAKTGFGSGSSSRTVSAKGDLGDASANVVGYEYEYEYEEVKVFRTSCCAHPICAACLQANPRLARYAPCLACLGGVRAVTGSSSSSSSAAFSSLKTRSVGTMARREEEDVNLNGALRDGDVFVLGGEDEDEDEDEGENERVEDGRLSPPPPYADSGSGTPNGKVTKSFQDPNTEPNSTPDSGKELQNMVPTPGRHYIQKNDTLRGLALKYGVDGRALCRLNNLSPTTLSTTPHLLHTRTVLDLPPSAKLLSIPQMDDARQRYVEGYDAGREREIELERTAKRLQLVVKEADWEVARAYAVLAQTSSSSSSGARTQPPESRRCDSGGEKSGFGGEKKDAKQGVTPQERAVDAYLEDNAWEARERAAGRGPGLRRAR